MGYGLFHEGWDDNMKRIGVCILGCRVNQSEGESLLEYFKDDGFVVVPFEEPAEVYLIHTCTVTGQADAKSRQMIRKAKRTNPKGQVIVTGCYAQTQPGALLDMPEADLVIGMKDREKILDLLSGVTENRVHVFEMDRNETYENLITPKSDRTRGFLKIEEGCDSYCTYCIIPIARGPVRSRPLEDVMDEIRNLEYRGIHEIVLTGIHTGAYGKDLGITLAHLMETILKETQMPRIRFGSLDPNEITPEFLESFGNERFMPHIHLALQSGDDEILSLMKRRYDTANYLDVVQKLRGRKGRELSITTDIMVGFPQEKPWHHKVSMDFIRKVGIDNLHIFKYSKRQGTKAADYPGQVDEVSKRERAQDMGLLKDAIHGDFMDRFIGEDLRVLVEKVTGRYGEGYSDNFLRVGFESTADSLKETEVVTVAIKRREHDLLIGDLK